MNIAVIVSEIDAEIEKLHRIREILEDLSAPARRLRAKRKRASREPAEIQVSKPQIEVLPKIEIVPPKQKREYRRRIKPVTEMPKALAPAPSTQPVFVARAAISNASAKPVFATPPLSEGALEAVVRQNLMRGVA